MPCNVSLYSDHQASTEEGRWPLGASGRRKGIFQGRTLLDGGAGLVETRGRGSNKAEGERFSLFSSSQGSFETGLTRARVENMIRKIVARFGAACKACRSDPQGEA